MEGRVAGIHADMIAHSSFFLRDLHNDSLHTQVEVKEHTLAVFPRTRLRYSKKLWH